MTRLRCLLGHCVCGYLCFKMTKLKSIYIHVEIKNALQKFSNFKMEKNVFTGVLIYETGAPVTSLRGKASVGMMLE